MSRRPLLVAVLGPTATGKSALGLALAARYAGEIVSCDSTAVYRGFDIGTDKVPPDERRGIPHHLVDVADPTEEYSAARYAREAEAAIRAITARGRLPVLVGGTGFYYRALTRGLFPGPGRDAELRARLGRLARRRGPERLHRLLAHVDPASARRIQPRDEVRIVRALEVYYATGRPLTEHFARTRAPLADYAVVPIGLRLPGPVLADRIARRVDRQFARGIVDEVERLLAAGVPETAHPFRGLVYRQVLALVRGLRGEREIRDEIVRENRRYARRQLIWFRKEPGLHWITGAGEAPDTLAEAERLLAPALEAVRP
ncbi:MAG TPA: tRNA (adenosine(37)-N6)-dimethylallyltransferase MiaA [Vicinamibacterales bacterium]|nr:tRNA (adenosine(37)-N6)-dimethylallyltransferase MiaA [Vicinamibacterales bacterium]